MGNDIYAAQKIFHISVRSILDGVLWAVQCGKTTAQTALEVKLKLSQTASLWDMWQTWCVNSVLTRLSRALFVIIRLAEAVGLMITLAENPTNWCSRLSALITPFAPIPIRLRDITSNWIYPPGRQRTIITINLSDSHRFVYSDVHYSKNMCFQLCFRLQCRAAPTLLMTPVPCNFFSVANSDYRVGVKLQAKHHLF